MQTHNNGAVLCPGLGLGVQSQDPHGKDAACEQAGQELPDH